MRVRNVTPAAWFVAIAMTIATGACTLLVDTGSLRSVEADDGSRDAIATRDGGDADASAIAPDASSADAGGFCDRNPGHTFCADFDRGPPVWDGLTTGAGPITIDGTVSFSPPNSLFTATVPGNAKNSEATKSLSWSKKLRVEMRVRISGANSGAAQAYFLFVEPSPPPSGYERFNLTLIAATTEVFFEHGRKLPNQQATYPNKKFVADLSSFRKIVLTWEVATGNVAIAVDDQSPALTTVDPVTIKGGLVKFGAPLILDSTASWSIWQDDLLVDAE